MTPQIKTLAKYDLKTGHLTIRATVSAQGELIFEESQTFTVMASVMGMHRETADLLCATFGFTHTQPLTLLGRSGKGYRFQGFDA